MLSNRFKCTGSTEDLDQAIYLCDEACHHAILDDKQRAISANNPASLLVLRHELTGWVEDIRRAVDLANESLDLHPRRLNILNNLGRGLLGRYERLGSLDDLDRAIEAFDGAIKGLWGGGG